MPLKLRIKFEYWHTCQTYDRQTDIRFIGEIKSHYFRICHKNYHCTFIQHDLNFHRHDVVSRFRDPQLQVGKN